MNNKNQNLKNVKTTAQQTKSHVLRTFFSSLFGIIALTLVLASMLTIWLNRTLTDNKTFVNTVAPLATKPDIQNFVAQKATDALIKNNSGTDLATSLLTIDQLNGKTPDQIQALVVPIVNKSVLRVVQSPAFAATWKSTIQASQQQFIAQINSKAPTITLDLHPAVEGVLAQLQSTDLKSVSNKITLKPDSGVLTLKGKPIQQIRRAYNLLQKGTIVIFIVTLLSAALCVFLSVHHAKTARRILLGIGIISLLLAGALQAPSFILQSTNQLQQKATMEIVNTLLHNLQLTSLIFGVFCVVVSIGSKIYSDHIPKK